MSSPRGLLLPLLLLLLFPPLFGLEGEKEIEKFYPCGEGSEKEFALLEFLIGDFRSRGLEVQVIPYDNREGLHSFSRSLRIDFSPSDERTTYLVLSLNGDTAYSYLNTLVLYNLALELHETPPSSGVTLLFLGGERNRPPVGTTAFLEDFTGEETGSVIYLDIDGPRLNLVSSTKGYNTPLWLLRSFSRAMGSKEIDLPQNGLENLFNRAGFGSEDDRLIPWMERDIPTLLLTGTEEKNRSRSLGRGEALMEGLKAFIKSDGEQIRDNREKNYLILTLPKRSFFVGEWHSILTIITLLSLFTVTVVFQSRNFTLNFRKYKGSLW
ncbi:MAG: hypothetical protein PQJ60_05550, partial [Spirochaetales bacterium]|nr:hypothetical protein [Spirochaetales bacterium]